MSDLTPEPLTAPHELTTIRNLLHCINVLLIIITLVALFVAYHLVELDRFLIAFGSAFDNSLRGVLGG